MFIIHLRFGANRSKAPARTDTRLSVLLDTEAG